MLKQKVIVLGGNGFLGSNFVEKLSANKISYAILDYATGCDLSTNDGQNKLANELSSIKSDDIDIVMMAAQLGSTLFNQTPLDPFHKNLAINMKCLDTFLSIVNQSSKKLHVSFFSTSEVYGNIEDPSNIKNNLSISIDPQYSRSLYAQEKLLMETQLHYFRDINVINTLRIFRPFNISGKHQKRGVVYEMVKSLMKYNAIYYSNGQSREITFVDYATDFIYSNIINRIEGTFDITQKNHIYLKDLAYCIKNCASKYDQSFSNASIKPLPNNNDYIKNRGSINVMNDATKLSDFQHKLESSNIVKQLMDQIASESKQA